MTFNAHSTQDTEATPSITPSRARANGRHKSAHAQAFYAMTETARPTPRRSFRGWFRQHQSALQLVRYKLRGKRWAKARKDISRPGLSWASDADLIHAGLRLFVRWLHDPAMRRWMAENPTSIDTIAEAKKAGLDLGDLPSWDDRGA